jgi:hypothetical protein
MNDIEKKLKKIRLSGSLKSHVIKTQIVEVVAQHLTKTVPKLLGLRLDNELLKVVCSCIETLVDSRKTGLDKKELVLLIWTSLYPDITEQELKQVNIAIDFLCSNKLVKNLKRCGRVWSFLFGSKNA